MKLSKEQLGLALYLADSVCPPSELHNGMTIEEACVMYSASEQQAYEAHAERVLKHLPEEKTLYSFGFYNGETLVAMGIGKNSMAALQNAIDCMKVTDPGEPFPRWNNTKKYDL